ncbi:Pr6Pr family membrane protein [Kitasatospora sp. MAP5-34]|uniref:Pr6Pr family membrane protein n=1 Tax=Kitasatospora sp. MAP5-34 TaxID=3035102 RepID=UPI0024772D2D|nr:Pr6Pr family membrane protein [Kitasatospora sp. MAP5-34]MDH6575239.1 hypothetical protein [Kitasatospora sp. MAP5-34]
MRDRVVDVLRLALGLLAAVAVGVQAYHTSTQGASLVNFFSYFTILSNLAGIVVLLAGGALGLLGRPGVPDGLRGAVVLYLAITGLVYVLLLSSEDVPLQIPWVNAVVHGIMPLVFVLDWLVDPPLRPVSYRTALGWLAFPLLYLVYSLSRGAAVDWYPYPFLDPRIPGGYGRVSGACTLIAGAFVLIGAVIRWTGNQLGSRLGSRPSGHLGDRRASGGVHT